MKSIVFLLLALALGGHADEAQAAVFLKCRSVSMEGGPSDLSVIIAGTLIADCKGKNDKPYSLILDGFAPGLLAGTSHFTLSCPTVNKKKLHEKGMIGFAGIRVVASGLVGANAGIALNHNLGFCLILGAEIGVGATANVGSMYLMTGTAEENDLSSMWWDGSA